jgi:23S rRNA (guanosine2251-2'-O)-methyltransferase
VIVYGRNPVREALRGRRAASVRELCATAAAAREEWLRELSPRIADTAEITRACGSDAHQGVYARAGDYPYVEPASVLRDGDADTIIVVLDEVQDPQNLGSICRTCECAGVAAVVIPERRAAEVTPAVCKASAGAVEHLSIARVRNVADFILQARRAGLWCYGASAPAPASASGAGRAPVPYDAPDYAGAPVALVLGSEGRGLRPRVAKACDELIALPLRGRVSSLGVAAAASALLYEILQKREQTP